MSRGVRARRRPPPSRRPPWREISDILGAGIADTMTDIAMSMLPATPQSEPVVEPAPEPVVSPCQPAMAELFDLFGLVHEKAEEPAAVVPSVEPGSYLTFNKIPKVRYRSYCDRPKYPIVADRMSVEDLWNRVVYNDRARFAGTIPYEDVVRRAEAIRYCDDIRERACIYERMLKRIDAARIAAHKDNQCGMQEATPELMCRATAGIVAAMHSMEGRQLPAGALSYIDRSLGDINDLKTSLRWLMYLNQRGFPERFKTRRKRAVATGAEIGTRIKAATEAVTKYMLDRDAKDGVRPVYKLTFKEVYNQLDALNQRFDGSLQIDLSKHTISVTTKSITWTEGDESVTFGRFDITFDWLCFAQKLPTCDWIHAIPLEPNYAGIGDEVSHPHVSGTGICFGSSAVYTISTMLQAGRFLEALVVTNTLLTKYNAGGSPFAFVETWHQTEDDRDEDRNDDRIYCENCDEYVDGEDYFTCTECGTEGCRNCMTCCRGCDERVCNEHLSVCPNCDLPRCTVCLKECPACKKKACECCTSQCSKCEQETCCATACGSEGCDAAYCADCRDENMEECSCGIFRCDYHLIKCSECGKPVCESCKQAVSTDEAKTACENCYSVCTMCETAFHPEDVNNVGICAQCQRELDPDFKPRAPDAPGQLQLAFSDDA